MQHSPTPYLPQLIGKILYEDIRNIIDVGGYIPHLDSYKSTTCEKLMYN